MRRSIGWIAVMTLIGALSACGNTTEGGSASDATVERTATTGRIEMAPGTTNRVEAANAGATKTAISEVDTTVGVTGEDGASTTSTSPAAMAESSASALAHPATETLDQVSVDGLLWMREEEKLARDVYLALSEIWDLPIFANIADSEQAHTDAVGDLLDRYDIADPMADDVSGVFIDPRIQALYDDLVEQGSQSLVDALIVGASIEDMDIVDLQLRRTGIATIDDVYANLEKGSRNHLRAFIRTLERQGGEYTPSYLTIAEFEAIISSPTERGRAGA